MSDPQLKAQLVAFLQENGWARQLSKDEQVARFQMKDVSLNKPVNIYFSQRPDDPQRDLEELEEALTTVRQFYGIPFAELRHRFETLAWGASRIGLHPRDFVTSRVPDRYVVDDTIEMPMASTMIGYMRSLVEGAATAEAKSMTTPSKAALRTAKDYVDECRFGHTFRGSFGFQVECPLREAIQFDMFGAEKPIGRKVSERIALAMDAVTQAFSDDSIDRLLRQSEVTSRICLDLADFLEDSGVSSFTLGVSFDTVLAIQAPPSAEFELRAAAIPMLREAAFKLEPPPEDTVVNVVGRIVELKAAGIPLAVDDENKRIVAIQWDSGEGRRKVWLELDLHQYADAIRAHEAGLHVQARGMLTQKGRRASLAVLNEFKVLD